MILLADCESRSLVDLKARGQHAYMGDPSTEVTVWSLRAFEWADSLTFEFQDLYEILDNLKSANRIKWTRDEPLTIVHWGSFDRMIVGDVVMTDDDGWVSWHPTKKLECHWVDAREISLTYGGPSMLKAGALFWGRDEAKHEGGHLISRFCIPLDDGTFRDPKSDPVRWQEFIAYARQDTNVMVSIVQTMMDMGGHNPADHWPYSSMIARMNTRGVPIDLRSAQTSVALLRELSDSVKEAIEEAYGFSPTQVAKVKEFLETEDCRKETLEEIVETTQDDEKREIAMARLAVSGAAVKKLLPMIQRAGDDGRVRDCFDYHGAHTRRLTSFGVQFQNMVRSPSDPSFFASLHAGSDWDLSLFESVRSNIRGFVCAPQGNVLVAADYSQIELRYGAWIAGEDWMLESFRENDRAIRRHGKKSPEAWSTDLYVKSAADLAGVPVLEIGDAERQFGKVVELSSIFGISAVGKDGTGGLKAYAEGMGVAMSEEDAWHGWAVYRRTHPNIARAWKQIETAVTRVIADRGLVLEWNGHRIEGSEKWVRIVRPSGFASYILAPRLIPRMNHDGTPSEDEFGQPLFEISCLRRSRNGTMEWFKTWGSDIFQTLVQGGSADLMLEGMLRAERAGYPPIMSIHDEIVCEVELSKTDSPDELCEIISELPDWADGLPVSAEGWIGPRFTK